MVAGVADNGAGLSAGGVLLAPLRNLLAVSADRPAGEQQDLQAAVRAAERLRTMVDALLDFSGAEAGTPNPDLQPTDLADLTAQTCSMFGPPRNTPVSTSRSKSPTLQ